MRKLVASVYAVLTTALIMSCNANKNLQTTTNAGLFSLSGTWTLSSTTDSTSMVGTTISVSSAATGSVKSISNNQYCVKENDLLWKNIKATDTGGFTLSALVGACNGKQVYNDGTVSVVDNNKITVTSRTATNSELVQAWDRVQ